MLAAYTAVRAIWLTHEAEFLAQLNDPKKAKEVQFMMQKLEQLYLERSKKTNPNTTNEAFEKCYQRFKKELYPRFQTAIKSKTKLELSDAEQTLLEELHQAALGFGKNPAEKYASVVAQIITEFPKWVAQIAGIPDSNNPAMTLALLRNLKKRNVSFAKFNLFIPSVYNISSRRCFYKSEYAANAVEIPPGDWTTESVDGLATEQHRDMVYKIVGKLGHPNTLGIVVTDGGAITFLYPADNLLHWVIGSAWKGLDWRQELRDSGDEGWDALFDAAASI